MDYRYYDDSSAPTALEGSTANSTFGVSPEPEVAETPIGGGLFVHPHWKQYSEMLENVPDIAHYALGVYITCVGFAGVIGNACVIYIFTTTKALRTPANIFIVNLAVSDLGFSLVNGFPLMTVSCFKRRWYFGALGCDLYGVFSGIFGLTSINTLAVIAFDRFYVIRYPLRAISTVTHSRSAVQVAAVWLWATIWASPPLLGWGRYIPEGLQTSCGFDFLSQDLPNRAFNYCLFSFGFVLPVCFACGCYAGIIRAVSEQRKQMARMKQSRGLSGEEKEKLQEIRLAKIAAVTIGLFIISWLPYASLVMISTAGHNWIMSPYVCQIPSMVAKASAIWNPFVYSVSHPKYRSALQTRFPWLCSKKAADSLALEPMTHTRRTSADSEVASVSSSDSEDPGIESPKQTKSRELLATNLSVGSRTEADETTGLAPEVVDQKTEQSKSNEQNDETSKPTETANHKIATTTNKSNSVSNSKLQNSHNEPVAKMAIEKSELHSTNGCLPQENNGQKRTAQDSQSPGACKPKDHAPTSARSIAETILLNPAKYLIKADRRSKADCFSQKEDSRQKLPDETASTIEAKISSDDSATIVFENHSEKQEAESTDDGSNEVINYHERENLNHLIKTELQESTTGSHETSVTQHDHVTGHVAGRELGVTRSQRARGRDQDVLIERAPSSGSLGQSRALSHLGRPRAVVTQLSDDVTTASLISDGSGDRITPSTISAHEFNTSLSINSDFEYGTTSSAEGENVVAIEMVPVVAAKQTILLARNDDKQNEMPDHTNDVINYDVTDNKAHEAYVPYGDIKNLLAVIHPSTSTSEGTISSAEEASRDTGVDESNSGGGISGGATENNCQQISFEEGFV